jgi:hypothetical protein
VENKVNAYMVFVGKFKGKRRRGRPMRGLEGNINVDLKRNELASCLKTVMQLGVP